MKTIFYFFLFTVSLGVARAQDATYPAAQPSDYPVPAVVYQVPVVYTAAVVYQMPVVYNAPVYFVPPIGYAPAGYAPAACGLVSCVPATCAPTVRCDDRATRSTVLYIGGGHVRYQVSQPTCGSTVTVIGAH